MGGDVLIRFVISELDHRSGRRRGLFAAALRLRDSGRLSPLDDDALESLWGWFNNNLPKPERLSLSPRPHAKEQAISWFKDSAHQHIRKMREFAKILERYDIQVSTITTLRPGYVTYEDDYQVCAYPFSDTQT
jgi:hypothetical protein